MDDPRIIMEQINTRLGRVLTAAQIGMHGESYAAFRKFVLDEFGNKGLEQDIKELCGPESR